MKKVLFTLVALLFTSLIFSQNSTVKITNQKTGITKIFQEKSRIRIKTLDGKKITGRFQILNDSTMLLKGTVISLADITKIKRNPLMLTIATDVVLFVVGVTTAGGLSYNAGRVSAPAAIALAATAGIMVIGPNILKGYPISKYDIEFVVN